MYYSMYALTLAASASAAMLGGTLAGLAATAACMALAARLYMSTN